MDRPIDREMMKNLTVTGEKEGGDELRAQELNERAV
jgi:hypothetical protein